MGTYVPGPLRWQLPPASGRMVWRQCTRGLCLIPPPGLPVLRRGRAQPSQGLCAARTALKKRRVSSTLLCSATSSGLHPESSSAPELEEVVLACLHPRGDCRLPRSGHGSALQVFSRSLARKGRASAHRLLGPNTGQAAFLGKMPEILLFPPASPGCAGAWC